MKKKKTITGKGICGVRSLISIILVPKNLLGVLYEYECHKKWY